MHNLKKEEEESRWTLKSLGDLIGQLHRHHVVGLPDPLPLVALDRLDLVLVVPFPDGVEVAALMPDVEIRPRVPLRLDPVVGDDAQVGVAHDVLLHNVQAVGEVGPVQLGRVVAVLGPQVVVVVQRLADRVQAVQLVEHLHLRNVRVRAVSPVLGRAHRPRRILAGLAHVVFADDDDPDLRDAVPCGVHFRPGLFAVDDAGQVEEGAIEFNRFDWNVESIQKWRLKDKSVFAGSDRMVRSKN